MRREGVILSDVLRLGRRGGCVWWVCKCVLVCKAANSAGGG
jgi:hypothetical protein